MGSSCCKGSDGEKTKKEETIDEMEIQAQIAASKRKEGNDSEPRDEFDDDAPPHSFRDDGKTPVEITPLTRAVNTLALDLYAKINSGNPNGNIVFSPLSIALALALTETGASGKTRTEIHKLIGCGKTPECGQLYGALQEEILKIPKTDGELRIANTLFRGVDVNVKESYLKKVKEWFKTEVKQVSFEKDTENARQQINRWVSDKTAGKIPELYGPDGLKAEPGVVMVNAIYLKMDWKDCFKLENTKQKIFYRFGGKEEQKVQFMRRLADGGPYAAGIDYAARKTLRVVELPYKGSTMSMYIVLPRRLDGITELETKLSVDRLISLFKSTTSRRVNLQIPRFGMRHVEPLLPIFKKMGFQTFDEFDQMIRVRYFEKVEITDAVHMAYIKVDEKGTEAAVVTERKFWLKAMNVTNYTFNFIADHPFLFFIVHKPTWSIVFMGKVNSVDDVS